MTSYAPHLHTQRAVVVALVSGGCSDVGPVRPRNEDQLLLNEHLGLFAVADGMGGHQAGETASRLAVAAVAETFGAGPVGAAEGAASTDTALTRMAVTLERANAIVCDAAAGDRALTGMGTTLTVLLLTATDAVIGSVGDSRAYLVRDGRAQQLTRDDTWLVSVLGAEGASAATKRAHPMRHVLTRIIGSRDHHEPEILRVPVQAGDVFVLTTDGLHNVVDDETIGQLASADPPAVAARRLVDAALARDTTDNTTAVVVRTTVE